MAWEILSRGTQGLRLQAILRYLSEKRLQCIATFTKSLGLLEAGEINESTCTLMIYL